MKHTEFEQNRIFKSAKALMAFFEQKLNTRLELLVRAPEATCQGDIQFSMALSQYGIWGVRAQGALAATDSAEIYDTFHSVLGNIGMMEDRRAELERMELSLEEDRPANVIPMRRPSRLKSLAGRNEKRWMLKVDCLIEGQYVSEIHKMALELHSHSSRYAFLEYRDLSPEQRRSAAEILALGSVSLFIPDLMTLSMDEQNVLQELLKEKTPFRPLLMVGTNIPFGELRSIAGVDLDFMNALARAYIKLTRPFAEYKDQGLIHYFLDSLSQNPS